MEPLLASPLAKAQLHPVQFHLVNIAFVHHGWIVLVI